MAENNNDYYGDPENVIRITGVQPESLGINDDQLKENQSKEEMLKEQIEKWLMAAKGYIDSNRNRSFDPEKTSEHIMAGIEEIAERIVRNQVAFAQQQRNSAVVQVGDYNIQLAEDKVITNAIRRDLKNYPAGVNFAVGVVNRYEPDEDQEEW